MCYQTTYTLPCEHVRTVMVYCPDAPPAPPTPPSKPGKSSGRGSSSSSSKHKHSSGSSKSKHHSSSSSKPPSSSSASATAADAPATKRQPCSKFSPQAIPIRYPAPPPPHFDGRPGASPTNRCPLPSCPFEARGRRWNCCWCGKADNVRGRCACVMLIDGAEYRCEHICCEQCEAGGGAGVGGGVGGGGGEGDYEYASAAAGEAGEQGGAGAEYDAYAGGYGYGYGYDYGYGYGRGEWAA